MRIWTVVLIALVPLPFSTLLTAREEAQPQFEPAVRMELELIKLGQENIKVGEVSSKKPPRSEYPEGGGSGNPELETDSDFAD
jgi:hypothetical protein